MSEDRLEKALEAIRSEQVNSEQLEEAAGRVREKLYGSSMLLCSEFQNQFGEYLDGVLSPGKKLLLEDHLGRCPSCRAKLAERKGERTTIPFRFRKTTRFPSWSKWAAAAAVLIGVLYLFRGDLDRMLAPGGPRATVASLTGSAFLISEGELKPGAAIDEGEVIRTGPGSRAVLRLADGSMIDVNERTELSLHAAWSGQSIELQRGDIILKAAKQRRGYLRVRTRDSIASVKGTIFAVSAGITGTVVSVVEGSVGVVQPGTETVLTAGEQAASNPALAASVQEAVSWSPDAETYIEILASLSKVAQELAARPMPSLRTQSSLIGYTPPGMVVYGALPNLGGPVSEALSLAEHQAAENPAFNQWWNSRAGEGLKQVVTRIQQVMPLLGDEIVYGICAKGNHQTVPVLLAEVRQGKTGELAAALDQLGSLDYHLVEGLLAVSNSGPNLQWVVDNMGKGPETPFTREIAARYMDEASWILGVDMESIISAHAGSEAEFVQAHNLKHIFVEQRNAFGSQENEVAVSFNGPRTGLASFLASTGSGGAAEYISSDSLVAFFASTREPRQMVEEMFRLAAMSNPSFPDDLAQSESKLGFRIADDLAASFGTELAFSLEGFTATGPVWAASIMVNNPSILDQLAHRTAEIVNAQLAAAGSKQQLIVSEETAQGRKWSTIRSTAVPVEITWTYDEGYIVAGSDRGVVLRAIATRHGGSPLVWSQAFQQQLPASAGLHPSGFGWLNTGGAFRGLEGLASNTGLQRLLVERDPVLVVFDANAEQIRAVSRTPVTSLLMNTILLRGTDERFTSTNGGHGR